MNIEKLEAATAALKSAKNLDEFGRSLLATGTFSVDVKRKLLSSGKVRVQASDAIVQTICDAIAAGLEKAVNDLSNTAKNLLAENGTIDAKPSGDAP